MLVPRGELKGVLRAVEARGAPVRQHPARRRPRCFMVVLLLGALLLGGCGGGATTKEAQSAAGAPSGARAAFCQHFEGDMLTAINTISTGSPKNIQPALDALHTAAVGFAKDARSGVPTIELYAKGMIAGISQLSGMLRGAGTLAVVNHGGIGAKLTDAINAVPTNYCPKQ